MSLNTWSLAYSYFGRLGSHLEPGAWLGNMSQWRVSFEVLFHSYSWSQTVSASQSTHTWAGSHRPLTAMNPPMPSYRGGLHPLKPRARTDPSIPTLSLVRRLVTTMRTLLICHPWFLLYCVVKILNCSEFQTPCRWWQETVGQGPQSNSSRNVLEARRESCSCLLSPGRTLAKRLHTRTWLGTLWLGQLDWPAFPLSALHPSFCHKFFKTLQSPSDALFPGTLTAI